MTQIKIKKARIFPSGEQFFPITHTNAVIDDNGYTVESRMQAVQDVVNQAQMQIGSVPNDLAPTEDSTNWVTSGGIYNAIQAVKSELTELEGELFKTTYDVVVTDVTSEYTYADSQKYGTVGNAIQTYSKSTYKSTKILKTDGITKVSLFVSSNANPSSLIQYVDDNDIIIELGGTVYTQDQSNDYDIVWPTGATAAYISMALGSTPTSGVLFIEAKTNVVTTPVIGDIDNLLTENKGNLVAAINELQPQVSEINGDLYYYSESGGSDINLSSNYTFSNGQKYGDVGSIIQTFTKGTAYKWAKIFKIDGVSFVVLAPPSDGNPSSLIQYVNDNNIIIQLDAVSGTLTPGVASTYNISWPDGATAAYITTATGTQSTSIFQHIDGHIQKKFVVGDLEDLSTPNKENIVAAINSMSAGKRLRVMSWNIGHYSQGFSQTSSMTSENYEENLVKWKKALIDINADIIGVQEYSEQFYKDTSASPQINITSQKDIFDIYKNKFIGTASGYISNVIFSRIALQNQSSVTYSAAEPSYRYYQIAEISFGGQTVAIINTHLDSTNGGDNNRESQIHELVEATKSYNYCIILADSNIARVIDDQLGSGQYEQFNDYAMLHGYDLYSLTNHGFQYGDIMTWPTTGTRTNYSNIPAYPHDFIIVKGFKTSNVVAVDNELSDHCAFFCDLDIV